jgi:Copper binding proteins, plastocyanin/azurin family
MRRTRGVAVGLVAVALALPLAGCGGDDEESAGTTETTTNETTTTDTTTEDTTTEEPTTGETTTAGGEGGSLALSGSVGPGFEISLFPTGGDQPSALTPGSYELTVEDLSSAHNFHFTGPGGVDVSTSVAEEGTETFTVELEAGTYEFVCDPHASQMNGSIDVGQ